MNVIELMKATEPQPSDNMKLVHDSDGVQVYVEQIHPNKCSDFMCG